VQFYILFDIKFCRQQQSCRGQKDESNHILFHTLRLLEAEISQFKKYSKCSRKAHTKIYFFWEFLKHSDSGAQGLFFWLLTVANGRQETEIFAQGR
jgi:hypothetical protein